MAYYQLEHIFNEAFRGSRAHKELLVQLNENMIEYRLRQ